MLDHDVWKAFPQYRKWFDKLFVADQFGHNAGPCGLAPTKSDWYIVRPAYNLSGMGAGADVVWIDAGDVSKVPPGYFWCEMFEGQHLSVTYSNPTHPEFLRWSSAWEGFKNGLRFVRWERVQSHPPLPNQLQEIDVPVLNVEFIGGKVIEVHLRPSPDPEFDELIPVWSDGADMVIGDGLDKDELLSEGYRWVESYDDADGFIYTPRLGFFVK